MIKNFDQWIRWGAGLLVTVGIIYATVWTTLGNHTIDIADLKCTTKATEMRTAKLETQFDFIKESLARIDRKLEVRNGKQ